MKLSFLFLAASLSFFTVEKALAQFSTNQMQKVRFMRNAAQDILSDLHSGDFNKDGYTDIVADGGLFINQSSFIENTSKPIFFLNDGTGKLVPTPSPFTHSGTSAMISSFADYNNDGYPDMLVYDFWANGMRLYNGGAGLSFTLAQTLPTGTHGAKGIFNDFDKDGDLDIINVSSGSSAAITLHIFENNGGNFTRTSYADNDPDFAPFLWAKDLNRDGRTDIIYFTSNFSEVRKAKVWIQNANKSFTLSPDETLHDKMVINNNSRFTYSWTDVNDDSFDDLLFFDDLSLLIGPDGDGKVLTHGAYSSATPPYIGDRYDLSGPAGMPFSGKMKQSTIMGDADNDGVDDIITYNFMDESSSIITLLTDPFNKQNHFMLQNINLGTANIKKAGRGLLLADLDNDNDKELISLGMDDTLRIFNNASTTTGIGNAKQKNQNLLSLYPNPSGHLLHWKTGIINKNEIQGIRIYNMEGRCIQTVDLNSHQKGIDISHLSNGSYLFSVELKNGNSFGRLFSKK